MASEPIFVSGGTGQVGRTVVRALQDRGAGVTVGTRDPVAVRALFGESVAAVRLDFDSSRALQAALTGARRLFLCPPSIREDAKAAVSAVLLGAAAGAGVEHVTVLSGISAAHDEASVSRRIELAAERSGIAWTHLRPNHFMQNYGTVYAESIRRGRLDFFMGNGRTSLIDVRDIGAAAAVTLVDGSTCRSHLRLDGPRCARPAPDRGDRLARHGAEGRVRRPVARRHAPRPPRRRAPRSDDRGFGGALRRGRGGRVRSRPSRPAAPDRSRADLLRGVRARARGVLELALRSAAQVRR